MAEQKPDRDYLATLFEAGYTGWDRGVVVTNDGRGNFSERPMTPLEAEARYVGLELGIDDEIWMQRAFIPITAFQSIQRHIGPLVEAQQQGVDRWRAIAGELAEAMEANEPFLANRLPSWNAALTRYREAVAEEEGDSAVTELQRFKADPEVQKAYADNRHPQHREVVEKFNRLQERAYPRHQAGREDSNAD